MTTNSSRPMTHGLPMLYPTSTHTSSRFMSFPRSQLGLSLILFPLPLAGVLSSSHIPHVTQLIQACPHIMVSVPPYSCTYISSAILLLRLITYLCGAQAVPLRLDVSLRASSHFWVTHQQLLNCFFQTFHFFMTLFPFDNILSGHFLSFL